VNDNLIPHWFLWEIEDKGSLERHLLWAVTTRLTPARHLSLFLTFVIQTHIGSSAHIK
jgi:hypothetical protein